MRSDMIKLGDARAPHRSLLRATGVQEDDFRKPFIAVCNSYVDIIPGHVHLDRVGEFVKRCVREAGGVPFVFNTIGIDDGIAMGHAGMSYSLAQPRDHRRLGRVHDPRPLLDGMICIPNCDKIMPGMLMGAVRVNIPTVFVSGGPMQAGKTPDGKTVDLIDVFAGRSPDHAARSPPRRCSTLEKAACPDLRLVLRGMYTANTMDCLCEAMGMALLGSGTALGDVRQEEAPRLRVRAAGWSSSSAARPRPAPRDRDRPRSMNATRAGHGDGRLAPTACCTS